MCGPAVAKFSPNGENPFEWIKKEFRAVLHQMKENRELLEEIRGKIFKLALSLKTITPSSMQLPKPHIRK